MASQNKISMASVTRLPAKLNGPERGKPPLQLIELRLQYQIRRRQPLHYFFRPLKIFRPPLLTPIRRRTVQHRSQIRNLIRQFHQRRTRRRAGTGFAADTSAERAATNHSSFRTGSLSID